MVNRISRFFAPGDDDTPAPTNVGSKPAESVFQDHTIGEAWVEICRRAASVGIVFAKECDLTYHHKDAHNLAELLRDFGEQQKAKGVKYAADDNSDPNYVYGLLDNLIYDAEKKTDNE